MPDSDSLEEWYERLLEDEFGRHGQAVGAYLEKRHGRELGEAQSPKEIVKRDLCLVFRQAVSEYIRQAVWAFLEEERVRRELTQTQLAEKAGVSQSTYSKIRTGEASFESILLFLRAMNLQAGAMPIPPALEQTVEGLLKVLGYLDQEVFAADTRRRRLNREDLEWLLHLDACTPWTLAYAKGDQFTGQIIADCIAAAISIRLGRSIPSRRFEDLVSFWRTRLASWEVCMATISGMLKAA